MLNTKTNKLNDNQKMIIICFGNKLNADKIADKFYGDSSLSWVIDEINGLSNLKDYELNKVIYYLPYKYLIALGIV